MKESKTNVINNKMVMIIALLKNAILLTLFASMGFITVFTVAIVRFTLRQIFNYKTPLFISLVYMSSDSVYGYFLMETSHFLTSYQAMSAILWIWFIIAFAAKLLAYVRLSKKYLAAIRLTDAQAASKLRSKK